MLLALILALLLCFSCSPDINPRPKLKPAVVVEPADVGENLLKCREKSGIHACTLIFKYDNDAWRSNGYFKKPFETM